MRRSRAVMRSVGAAALALVLVAQPVVAVTLLPSVALSGTGETVHGSLGSIAASAGRVFVTYIEQQRAWVRTSADGGVTFTPPVQVSDPTAVPERRGREWDRVCRVDRDAFGRHPTGLVPKINRCRGDLDVGGRADAGGDLGRDERTVVRSLGSGVPRVRR